jgi:hypothetical protein
LRYESHVEELPNLSILTQQIHSISATSAGIKRQFSIVGLTIIDRRTSLDPEEIDNMLCIRIVARLDSNNIMQ